MLLSFELWEWLLVIGCAALIGFTKTGIQGGGLLVVPLAALALPAKESTGFILPMLVAADIMAILYWHQHVDWRQLARLLPWAFIGIVAGFFCLNRISNTQLLPLLGGLILLLLGMNMLLESKPAWRAAIPHSRTFAAVMGVLMGAVSMLANMAGPLATIYLLALRFEKKTFIGTNALFFGIVNTTKLPFSGKLGLITMTSLTTNLVLLPALLAGGAMGIYLVHRISQKIFNRVVYLLAAMAALYLCVTPLFT